MTYYKGYEMVIGLEVHVELATKTKIFCSCPTDFGAAPNTQVCPVCMGLPGTLPVLNRKVVEYAVKAGSALDCTIARRSREDRKNYFYPDLPKAYQISQYDLPLCEHGYLDIETEAGSKRIGITRIHIEEDAGKLMHSDGEGTLIDLNRCGVPLIEIVSEPDIRSADEAKAYLRKLRAVMLYAGVSDCRMEQGSFRCDVNLSVRKIGEETFGTRTEMKNLNSFLFVGRAIEYEYKRQVDLIESGGEILQETRRFDPADGKTYAMRSKENANDYRYFPDPDLPPILLSEKEITGWREALPELPDARGKKYRDKYGLTAADAELLTSERQLADYFERAADSTPYPKLAANLIAGELMRLSGTDGFVEKISPAHLGAIARMAGEEIINSSTAKKLIARLWESDEDPEALVKREDLAQINDETTLIAFVRRAIAENPKSVADYKNGKQNALKALIGKAMALSAGKANPLKLNELVQKELDA